MRKPFEEIVIEKLENLERRFDKVENKLDEHDGKFERIEGKLKEHDKRFDNIDSKLNQHDSRFDDTESEIQYIRMYLEQNIGNTAVNRIEITQLHERLAVLEDKLK